MAFTIVPITGTWGGHTGKVVVQPVHPMTNGGNTVTAAMTYNLVAGTVTFNLAATDDVGTIPTVAQYEFYLEISALPNTVFSTVIPKAQAGSGINIVTQLPWGAAGTSTPQAGLQIPGGAKLYSGSGAPTFTASAGDRYHRVDTSSTANQREYICTGGTSWTALSF